MKNALNNQVGMLGDMFLWLVANLKQGVIYFIKQACGNDILASVYACFNKGGAVCIVFVFMVVAFTINVVVTHECKLAFVSCIVMMSCTYLKVS